MLHNFPAQLTTFIGRTAEIHAITKRLLDPACRLLTLVGPGGIGKSRLAIQAALDVHQQFRDGVYFVPLQPLAAPELLIYAIADVLGVGMYERETPRSQLIQYFQRRHMLLVLDNFEHLSDAADLLVDVLAYAPTVRLLVTSREVLNLQGEQIFSVGGLTLPDTAHFASLEASDAIRLFVARAQQVRHDFSLAGCEADIVQIARLVEGTPLAIELAAAWTRTLSCKEIAAEIEKSADFLSTTLRDVPERHRTMRAVFDQSWKLLTAEAQTIFRRLSLFRGPFTREAAEAVSGASLLALSALVSQSLLRVSKDGYYAVHELLRQYAEEKLNPDEKAQTLENHSHYYLKLLHRLDRKIKSGQQIAALDEIEHALDNIREALNYAAEHHRRDWILPAYECLALYYQMRCRLGEGYETFSIVAEKLAGHDEEVYGLLLLSSCWFAAFTGMVDDSQVRSMIEQVADIVRRHRIRGAAAMMITQMWRMGDGYVERVEENLAAYRERRDWWGVAWSLNHRGALARRHHQIERAKSLLEESIATFERVGDRWGATWTQALLGLTAEDEGRFLDAYQLYVTRLHTCQEVGDAGGVAWSLQQIAKVSLELKDMEKARFYCRESLRVALDISMGNSVHEAIARIASMFLQFGKRERAAELYAAVLNHLEYPNYYRMRVEEQLEALKTELPPERYMRSVEKGHGWHIRDLGWSLLDELADHPLPSASSQQVVEALTERELEVLRLAAEGLSNREIAARLVVTVGTVKKHLNNIFGKLGVARRTEAIARAQALKLFS